MTMRVKVWIVNSDIGEMTCEKLGKTFALITIHFFWHAF